MKEGNKEEAFFHLILAKSKIVVPFPDFDDKVMGVINDRFSKKSSIARDLKLSWIFFVFGSTFGIMLTTILPTLHQSILGFPLAKLNIPFMIIFGFFASIQLEKLLHFYKRKKVKTIC